MNLHNMKKLNYIIPIIVLLNASATESFGQQKNKLLLSLSYDNVNNDQQYLEAHAKAKINGRLILVPGIKLKFYITNDSPSNLLGQAITDEQGNAYSLIPASAKQEWNKSTTPGFIVESEPADSFESATANFDLTRAKLKIDTLAGEKVVVTLMKLKDSSCLPVKGVDIIIGVKRQGSHLNISETPTYTTDSLGQVTADFKRDKLPGDSKGNLILTARVEDDDNFGTVSADKIVPWGVPVKFESDYSRRSLFARRNMAPIWLDLMAYSIIAIVWGVVLYLILQIGKIKKLGAE
jgi:hypothetical protein